MKWIKQGLVFKPGGEHNWMASHAQVPLVDQVSEDVLRIYFGTRDAQNRTVTTFVEVEAGEPRNVLYLHDRPALGLGELGRFDDSGAMPSWLVNRGGVKYLYYTGWNVGTTVPYHNSVGLAASRDGGRTFERVFDGPVLERTHAEPYFCSTPCVLEENGLWRMWYLSCTGWETWGGKPEARYHTKYAESDDGVRWDRRGVVAIDFKAPEEAGIVRPSVIKAGGRYRMWFSYRGLRDYRVNKEESYRVGYAESAEGVSWSRKDELAGIDVSASGWDSKMIAYPYVYEHRGRLHMMYNGNDFGATGFGHAVLDE